MTGSNENLEQLEQTVSKLQELLVEQQRELTYLRLTVETKSANQNKGLTVPTEKSAGRRRFLKSIAGLGGLGLAVSALTNVTPAAAKFVGSNKAGAISVLPSTLVSGDLPLGVEYGLIASSRHAVDLNIFTQRNAGIYGEGENFGVYGYCYGGLGGEKAGVGGIGEGDNTSGVYGFVGGAGSVGVLGSGTGANNVGVRGHVNGTDSWGVHGVSHGTNGIGLMGHGAYMGLEANGTIYGGLTRSTDPGGVGLSATGRAFGVAAKAEAGTGRGVFGEGYIGVEGFGSNNSEGPSIGIYGRGLNYAGLFNGVTAVIGAFTASTKNFRIDHPQDPANRYLQHASIESDQMLNLYSGTLTLDATGQGKVSLPEWFEILNHEFSYQLTALGATSQVYIAAEIKNGQFQIAGGLPGQRVSWLVTGVRQDAWAKANPLEVEKTKPKGEQGSYLHPQLYGQPEEKTLFYKKPVELPTKKA